MYALKREKDEPSRGKLLCPIKIHCGLSRSLFANGLRKKGQILLLLTVVVWP